MAGFLQHLAQTISALEANQDIPKEIQIGLSLGSGNLFIQCVDREKDVKLVLVKNGVETPVEDKGTWYSIMKRRDFVYKNDANIQDKQSGGQCYIFGACNSGILMVVGEELEFVEMQGYFPGQEVKISKEEFVGYRNRPTYRAWMPK